MVTLNRFRRRHCKQFWVQPPQWRMMSLATDGALQQTPVSIITTPLRNPQMSLKTIIALYVSAIVAANLLVWWLGPWWSPLNALLLIGLDLSLRDKLHDRWGFGRSLVLVVVAGAVSFAVNPAASQIAVASVVAFVLSGVTDAAVYQRLIKRPTIVRMNGSNVAGAAVDSLVFPTIAFGALMPHIVVLQFVAKVIGGACYAHLLARKSA
jgi:hypothetical protein